MLHYDSMYSKHGQISTTLTFHPYKKSEGATQHYAEHNPIYFL